MKCYECFYFGINYVIHTEEQTLLDSFVSRMNNIRQPEINRVDTIKINVVLATKKRCMDIYEKTNKFFFNNNHRYYFVIKEFDIYLDTGNNYITIVSDMENMKRFSFSLFSDLHFKIFSKINSIMFHAGLVHTEQKSLLMCGKSRKGKSTTCARAVMHGYDFLTDEVVILFDNSTDIILYTLERRLRIRREALKMFHEIEYITSRYKWIKETEGFLLYTNNEQDYIKTSVDNMRCICIEKAGNESGFECNNSFAIKCILETMIKKNTGNYLDGFYRKNIERFLDLYSGQFIIWKVPQDFESYKRQILAL